MPHAPPPSDSKSLPDTSVVSVTEYEVSSSRASQFHHGRQRKSLYYGAFSPYSPTRTSAGGIPYWAACRNVAAIATASRVLELHVYVSELELARVPAWMTRQIAEPKGTFGLYIFSAGWGLASLRLFRSDRSRSEVKPERPRRAGEAGRPESRRPSDGAAPCSPSRLGGGASASLLLSERGERRGLQGAAPSEGRFH